jgi:hypothetical protein
VVRHPLSHADRTPCPAAALMVFKSVRDLLSAAAPGWTFSMPVVRVIQDHPAHIA